MSGALTHTIGSARAPGVINPSIPSGSVVGAASWGLNNDGTYTISGVAPGNWIDPASAAIASNYEVRVDITVGAFTGGSATAIYLSLGTNRAWTESAPGSVTFTATFREIATGLVRSIQVGKTLDAS